MITITLDEDAKAALFKITKDRAAKMKEMLASGSQQANIHLQLYHNGHFLYSSHKYSTDGACLLLHIKLTSKKGFVMTYYSDLAKPGTEIWEIVAAAIREEGK